MESVCPKNSSRFLSTPSVGRATDDEYDNAISVEISIHALRGEGDRHQPHSAGDRGISIHALRGEGDAMPQTVTPPRRNFYPRPPWGGRRYVPLDLKTDKFISIHALRGEGDRFRVALVLVLAISSHALRGEGDSRCRQAARRPEDFYPRPPWGGRLWYGKCPEEFD